jgi:hypothetical protein
MDRSCHAELLARAAGPFVLIDPEEAELTHSQVGNASLGKLNFDPLLDLILHEQPGLLD